MTRDREHLNWDKAMTNHREMQLELIRGVNIDLFDDVERLLPKGQLPKCIEKVMEIDHFEPEVKRPVRKTAADRKRSKAVKIERGMPKPEGALDGFVQASKLTKRGRSAAGNSAAPKSSDAESDDFNLSAIAETASRRSAASSGDAKPAAKKRKLGTASSPRSGRSSARRLTDQGTVFAAGTGFSSFDPQWLEDDLELALQSSNKNTGAPVAPEPVCETPTVPLEREATSETPQSAPRRPIRRKQVVLSSSPAKAGALHPSEATSVPISSPIVPQRKSKTKPRLQHDLLELEVGVSDDDDPENDYDSSGEEDESDRRFAGNFEPTQAPRGYNQRKAYLDGLATQVNAGGPAFADRSAKRDAFLAKARKPILLSQEREGPSSDYEGSFICGDDTVEYDEDAEDSS